MTGLPVNTVPPSKSLGMLYIPYPFVGCLIVLDVDELNLMIMKSNDLCLDKYYHCKYYVDN